ncbi:hypothetical protein BJX65DRAFT_283896 [Aspergillus insuetus]
MVNDTRTCFFPSGAVATDNVACSSDEYTSCCGTHDLSLSNGLCLSVVHQPYVLSRGACTDPEWACEEFRAAASDRVTWEAAVRWCTCG